MVSDNASALGLVWFAYGQGFLPADGGPGLPVSHPTAIDWPSGGPQELLAHAPDGSHAMVIAGLDTESPTIETIDP